MPKSRTQPPRDDADPVASLYDRADAIYRWTVETCHQHDRFARVLAQTVDAREVRAAQELVHLCDETLCAMLKAYEKEATQGRPAGDDEWWHRANGLWHACREYVRRHDGCDRATRRTDLHSAEQLGALQVQYELEASALLALRHAADAYRKARPQAA